jgi:hypothetical protein
VETRQWKLLQKESKEKDRAQGEALIPKARRERRRKERATFGGTKEMERERARRKRRRARSAKSIITSTC